MAGQLKSRNDLISYIDQLGGTSGDEMEDIIASLVLDDDTREVLRNEITNCGGLTATGMNLLVNSVSFKEPPSQQASRIHYLSLLDACGRFNRAEWVDFLNKTYLENESIVVPTDRPVFLAIVDNGDNTMTLEYATDDSTIEVSPDVVCLGSSTMAGMNASTGFSVGSLLNAWITSNATGSVTFQNLAVGGYYSDRLLPDGESPMVDISKNVTRAMSFKTPGKKTIVIIWLASNDAAINTNAKYMDNLRRMDEYVRENGGICFFATTQPRTSYDATLQQILYDGAILIKQEFKERCIDIFDLLRDKNAPTLGVIRAELNSGDNIHLNNTGHGLIAEEAKTVLANYFTSNTGVVDKFTIEISDFATGPWTVFEDNILPTTITKLVTPKNSKYYRVKVTYEDPAVAPRYSNVDTLFIPVTTTIPPPAPGAQRVLVDLGGDGSGGNGAITPSPDGFGNYWNNVLNVGGDSLPVLNNAKDITGALTSIGLTVVTRIDGEYNVSGTGMNYGGSVANVGDYPATAVRDNAYAFNNPATGGVYRVRGLLADRTYSIKFWGNRAAPEARVIQIRRSGDTIYQEYNSSNNTDFNNAAIFTGITGVTQVDFEIKVKAGSSFGHISVIDIQSISNSLTTTTTTTTTIPPNTQRMLIDIGGATSPLGSPTPSPDINGRHWNNIDESSVGLKLPNMVDTVGNPSGHTLEFLGLIGGSFGMAGTQFNGAGATISVGDYPLTATGDNIYASDTAPAGASWKIGGLRPNYTYRFKFWGSRNDPSTRILEMKRSTDTVWREVATQQNTNFNQAIVFDTITGLTEITFDIRVKAGSSFAHISVVDIEGVSNAITTTSTTTTTGTTTTTTEAPNSRRVLIDIGSDAVDYTTNVDSLGRKWNNVAGNLDTGYVFPGMLIRADAVITSSMTFTIITDMYGTFPGNVPRGVNPNGPTSPVGDYPATATRDNAYVHSSANGLIRFGGFDPTKIYRFKFWGSRIDTTGVRTTRIAYGADVKTYNAVGNTDYNNAAIFTVSGSATYDFSVTAGTDGTTFGHLSIVDIQWNA